MKLFVGLLLVYCFGPMAGTGWWLIAVAGLVVFVLVAVFHWREVKGMLNDLTRRLDQLKGNKSVVRENESVVNADGHGEGSVSSTTRKRTRRDRSHL